MSRESGKMRGVEVEDEKVGGDEVKPKEAKARGKGEGGGMARE